MAPLPEALRDWLRQDFPCPSWDGQAELIPQDGSSRQFYRLVTGRQKLVLMYSPHDLAESRAWHNWREHLAGLKLPVPRLLAAKPEAGMFLMNDLGRESLQQAALAAGGAEEKLRQRYRPVIDMLVCLQSQGERGARLEWCFDGPRLDAAFLRQREMDYFYRQVVLPICPTLTLTSDLELVAEKAAAAQPWGLTHRDFQSRNLVLNERGKLGLVDFQGARLGPAQYDLASLLNDPYVDLPLAFRQAMLEYYLARLSQYRQFDVAEFQDGLPWVSLSRNLQTLAAFTFLSREKNKPHFQQYIIPAAGNLRRLLASPPLSRLGGLRQIAEHL